MWNRGTATMSPNGVDVKTCPYCAEEIQPEAVKCKHCHSWIGRGPANFLSGGSKLSSFRLMRTVNDRKLFGVCGGIGRLLGVDPTIVRVVFAVTTVFTVFLPGVLTYAIMAWAIPNEDEARGMS